MTAQDSLSAMHQINLNRAFAFIIILQATEAAYPT